MFDSFVRLGASCFVCCYTGQSSSCHEPRWNDGGRVDLRGCRAVSHESIDIDLQPVCIFLP